MNGIVEGIDLAAGAVLLTAVLIVWRRGVTPQIRLLAAQGAALALLVVVLAVEESSIELALVAMAILVVKAIVLPLLISRSSTGSAVAETDKSVNPTISLLAAAALTALAFVVARPIIALQPSPQIQALPVGFAVVFLGFLLLVTRHRAAAQVIGFVLIDNGIAVVAFLTTTGVPLVVELGAALTVLLAVVILQVLTTRMQHKFGDTDLDDLQELADT